MMFRAWFLASAFACFIFAAFSASADAQKGKKKKGAGPALGTWQVSIQGKNANLVFTERDGPRTAGYFDMSPTGPMKAVAVVFAVMDPASRTVRITGREIHTTVPSIVAPLIEGTLAPDNKRIEKMRSLVNPNAPFGIGVWLREAAPVPPMPSVADALNDSSDRSLLFQQCSGDFRIDGVRIAHAPIQPLLARLEKATDKHIQSLAKTRRVFQDLIDLTIAEDVKVDRTAEAEALRGELWSFVGDAFQNDFSYQSMRKQIGGLMESEPIKNILLREKKAARLACMRELTVLAIQRNVRSVFAARKATPLDKADQFVTGIKVDGDGFGALTIKNNTGRDLHHCFIAPRLTIDQAKMDAFEKEFRKEAGKTRALALAFGVNLATAAETDEYMLLFNRLDKGSNNYLSRWPQGATIQIDLAQPEAIKRFGAAITAWIGSDEGMTELGIDITKVKTDVAMQQPKERHVVDAHGLGASKELAFSANGKWLASAGPNPHVVIWDASTGQEKGKLPGIGVANTVAFHPNNAIIAVGDDSGRIRLVSINTMKELSKPLKHVPAPKSITGSSVEAVAFSKDGKFLASASADKTAKLWNLVNGQPIAVLTHPSYVRSLALSTDGATIATACENVVRLWSVARKETTATFEGHKSPVIALAFHPGGKILASGSMDGTVKLWDIATGKNPADVLTNARNISLAFSPDGKRLAVAGDFRGVQLFDAESGNTLISIPTANGPVAFGPGGAFATGFRVPTAGLPKSQVKIWDLP